MKILVADKFDEEGLARLASAGHEVSFEPDASTENLIELLDKSRAQVLVVRSTKVPAEVTAQASTLALIVRAGAGVDNIDIDAASGRGVFVANCPGKNSIAVAELTMALILECDRRMADQVEQSRRGQWNKKEFSKARGLAGQTLGLVGFGSIAREVAARARAFGMDVRAWSRSLTSEHAANAGVQHCRDLAELAASSDIVSVHVAATDDTKGLINRKFVEAMREGATLINTSRGSVLDESAVAWAIDNKRLRVGIDVFADEPKSGTGEHGSMLARHASTYATHHIGASTEQAQSAIADEALTIIEQFADTGRVRNCVNREERSPAHSLLTVRHKNQPGVLATIFSALGDAHINVLEMENVVYQGAEAACARIRLSSRPSDELLDKIVAANSNIIGTEVTSF